MIYEILYIIPKISINKFGVHKKTARLIDYVYFTTQVFSRLTNKKYNARGSLEDLFDKHAPDVAGIELADKSGFVGVGHGFPEAGAKVHFFSLSVKALFQSKFCLSPLYPELVQFLDDKYMKHKENNF